jgi:NAD(P)-dependent dehydrogenase (short-subunit alcohol dehydrogenase family)
MTKVAVVTGSSSGIGHETSLLLARNQITTYATMRNVSKSDELRDIASKEKIPLKVAQLDVNDDSSVNNAINHIIKENGRIDILVNNVGYDLFGSLEESNLEEIKQQFETNVFGVIRTTKAVIPTMRKQGNGTIVNISSVGGTVGLFPFTSAYHASKFAIEGFTESLRQELADFNIRIILIEPGSISTNFAMNIKTAKGFDLNKSPYAKLAQQVLKGFESIPNMYTSQPSKVAQTILNVLNSPNPVLRNPVGKDAESIFKARDQLSDKAVGTGKLYGNEGLYTLVVIDGMIWLDYISSVPNQTSFIFISRKDITKIAYIIPALIRKVAPPIELYKNPPKISPMILARPPKLPATPCTAP